MISFCPLTEIFQSTRDQFQASYPTADSGLTIAASSASGNTTSPYAQPVDLTLAATKVVDTIFKQCIF